MHLCARMYAYSCAHIYLYNMNKRTCRVPSEVLWDAHVFSEKTTRAHQNCQNLALICIMAISDLNSNPWNTKIGYSKSRNFPIPWTLSETQLRSALSRADFCRNMIHLQAWHTPWYISNMCTWMHAPFVLESNESEMLGDPNMMHVTYKAFVHVNTRTFNPGECRATCSGMSTMQILHK